MQDVPAAATGIDALAFKLTPAGAVVWANTYHAYTDDEDQAVRFTADGNIVVGGFTNFGAVAPVTSHMLITKLASANGAIMFQNILVARIGNNTYTSKAYDIIETPGPQYYLSGPATFNNNVFEMMYRTNDAGFGINWYRYNRMNYNVGFGLDYTTAGEYPGIGYFSSMRNPDTTAISDSHIMKTNFNGQTCNFCIIYPPYYLQVNLQIISRNRVIVPEAVPRKLAWKIFGYSNILICNTPSVNCAGAATANDETTVKQTPEKTTAIQISPNPVQSTLHIQFKDITPGRYTIMLVNRQGNVVLQKTNVYCDNNAPVALNVSALFACTL